MINFINSWLLPALAAAAVPIILHFLSKRKVKVIPFSSLRFLSLLENKRIKHIRLYQLLLVLIRTLFIVFLVLAFARPAWKSALFNSSSSARTTAVLLFDNSFSMQAFKGAHTLFERSKTSARQILSTFSDDDPIFVLTPQKEDSVAGPFTPSAAQNYLKKLRPVYRAVDFRVALQRAEDIFRRYANYNRELYLLSDLRINKNAFPDSLPLSGEQPAVRFFTVTAGDSASLQNIGIDTLIIGNRIFEARKPVALSVRLRNDAAQARETLLNIYIAGKRAAMQKVLLPPLGTRQVDLTVTAQSAGFQLVSAETDDDDLPVDNRYYGSFYIPEQIRILLVSRQLNPLFAAAVDVLHRKTVLSISRSDYQRWQGAVFQNYQLIVLDDPPDLSSDVLNRLKNYIRSGNNLFLIPGMQATLSQLNRLSRYLLNHDLFAAVRAIPGEQGFYTLRKNDLQKPLFRDWSAKKTSGELPHIYKYFTLLRRGQIMLGLQNGAPFLTRFSTSAGKVFVLTSRPDTQWNDWPLSGLFVPLLYRFWSVAGQTPAYTLMQTTGKPIALRLPLSAGDTPYLFGKAGGTAYPAYPQVMSNSLLFRIPAREKPGHYLLRQKKHTVGVVSVNLPSAELKRPYVNFKDFKPAVIAYKSPDQLKKLRRGQELWYLFLTLALLMLVLEFIIIKKLEGKNSA